MVDIVDVTMSEIDGEHLLRRNIEAPKPRSQTKGGEFYLVGWVIGRNIPVAAVEVSYEDSSIQRVPIDVERPDVAAAFPRIPDAQQSGFRATIAAPDTAECELVVCAVLQDESRVPLSVIQARQHQNGELRAREGEEQEHSGSLARFFRRVFGTGGG
jgi:hypothetical protein